MFKIYGDSISGNCLKAKFTADFLNTAYEWQEMDLLKGESRKDEYLSVNPFGQVPALELENGNVITQSNAIICFIAHESSLLPKDKYERAKVDEWLYWEQYSHEPYVAVNRFQMRYLNKSVDELDPWRVDRGNEALDFMNTHLSNHTWLANDQFSVADISLYAYTSMAEEGGFTLDSRPEVLRWLSECKAALKL